MIQRQRVFLLRLLHDAQCFQVLGENRGAAFQLFQRSAQLVRFPLANFHLRAQLAQFALQRQWSAGRFLAPRHRVAVITHAVLQQEIAIGVRSRQRLRGGSIGDQETTRQPGQQALRRFCEPVGQPQHVAQPAAHAWMR